MLNTSLITNNCNSALVLPYNLYYILTPTDPTDNNIELPELIFVICLQVKDFIKITHTYTQI